jgi:hypothetical protein
MCGHNSLFLKVNALKTLYPSKVEKNTKKMKKYQENRGDAKNGKRQLEIQQQQQQQRLRET